MKKILFSILMLTGPFAYANGLTDQIEAGFVGHAKLSLEFNTEGKTQPEFLVNFVEIGRLHKGYLGAIDSGILGTVLPQTHQFAGANFTSGGKLHLSPLIKSYVTLPAEWAFLNTVELDARVSYNWTQRHPFYGLAVAYPF